MTTEDEPSYMEPPDWKGEIYVFYEEGSPVMKTREEVARFIEDQLHWEHRCPRNKATKLHYGFQDARVLLDFIYGRSPASKEEELINIDPDKN